MGRRLQHLNQRDKFLIFTNGKRSEKNYLELLKQNRSIYDVTVRFLNESPLNLVNKAIKYKGDANRVWCVFDIDQFTDIEEAAHLAKKNGVKVAYSNLAFEVWLINHYERFNREMSVNNLIKHINRLLSENGFGLLYEKDDEDLLKKAFIPKLNQAMLNSKIDYQNRCRDFDKEHPDMSEYPFWKWCSSTNMFQLVEDMRLERK